MSGYVPQAAHSWENVDDTTWRFHLREGATFHNGEPLDAEAVKWNIDRVRHPIGDIPLYQQWAFVKEVIVVDDLTVDIISNSTRTPTSRMTSATTAVPCCRPITLRKSAKQSFNRNPVGSGPYTAGRIERE